MKTLFVPKEDIYFLSVGVLNVKRLNDHYTGLNVMLIAWFVYHVSVRIIQYSISWGSLVNEDEVLKMGMAFGRAVKLRRVELGYNQEGLADKAELARSFVSSIERGVAKASIASVWKLAQALNCNPSDLWITAERLYDAR